MGTISGAFWDPEGKLTPVRILTIPISQCFYRVNGLRLNHLNAFIIKPLLVKVKHN